MKKKSDTEFVPKARRPEQPPLLGTYTWMFNVYVKSRSVLPVEWDDNNYNFEKDIVYAVRD